MKYILFRDDNPKLESDLLNTGLSIHRYETTKSIDAYNFQKTFWSHLSNEEVEKRIMEHDHKFNVLGKGLFCDGHFVCENGSEFKVCLCNGDDSVIFIKNSLNPDLDIKSFLEWLRNRTC